MTPPVSQVKKVSAETSKKNQQQRQQCECMYEAFAFPTSPPYFFWLCHVFGGILVPRPGIQT